MALVTLGKIRQSRVKSLPNFVNIVKRLEFNCNFLLDDLYLDRMFHFEVWWQLFVFSRSMSGLVSLLRPLFLLRLLLLHKLLRLGTLIKPRDLTIEE